MPYLNLSIGGLVDAKTSGANNLNVEKPEKRAKEALLTDENRAESVRLKALYEKSTHGLSQAAFGDSFGIGSQGTVWQCLNGKGMPISLKAAQGFAAGLKCQISDFSPRLAKLAEGIAHSVSEANAFASVDSGKTKTNVIAIHPEDPLPDGFVYIKESSIAFAGGNGRTPIIELIEESEMVAYSVSWFRKKRINPEHVRRYRVTDVSMVPFLFDNDTILVNHAETNIINGKIYAFRYGDDLRVKELHKHLDGTLILRSINPLFKDEVVPPDLVQEHISIIGRVRDRSGSGGF